MTKQEFKESAEKIIDFITDYIYDVEKFPVKSNVKPREVFEKLNPEINLEPQSIQDIFEDFRQDILPGITHWQSPSFHAYFPANNSEPSVLAEFLTAGLGLQCMIWATSPSATELEEMMMNWLKKMLSLPQEFNGVIQDTASTATLVALLTAREKSSNFLINSDGFINNNFRVYCSTEAHSSIEKAVKITGIGSKNLKKIAVNLDYSININLLEREIINDIESGCKPLFICGALGTTGSAAVDDIESLVEVAKKYNIWLHIDAAYAGSALILPEFDHLKKDLGEVDSFVFNPHKWLFTNFDCSAYFVKDKSSLIQTFEIMPEYLKTGIDSQVNNYRDWGIQLGRRFRALKLWFVLRNYGLKTLQEKIREHIRIAAEFEDLLLSTGLFEIMAPRIFSLVCFRYNPDTKDEENLNLINEQLLAKINDSGKCYLAHTKLNGKYTLRAHFSQTNVQMHHAQKLYNLIMEMLKI